MAYMMKVDDKMLEWENAGKLKLLSIGYSLRPPELLFRKIEDDEIEEQIKKLKAKSKVATNMNENSKQSDSKEKPVQLKPEIIYDDFDKLDLRIGTIINAEKVEKADKLLKLQVDLGFEKRT